MYIYTHIQHAHAHIHAARKFDINPNCEMIHIKLIKIYLFFFTQLILLSISKSIESFVEEIIEIPIYQKILRLYIAKDLRIYKLKNRYISKMTINFERIQTQLLFTMCININKKLENGKPS